MIASGVCFLGIEFTSIELEILELGLSLIVIVGSLFLTNKNSLTLTVFHFGDFFGYWKRVSSLAKARMLKSFLNNRLIIKQAKQIHAQIIITSLNNLQPLLLHQFLLSTNNCSIRQSVFLYVQEILYILQKPDVFSWGSQKALLDLYMKLGDTHTAKRVFHEMPEKNVVSWNSILSGYLKAGNLGEAQRGFYEISKKDVLSWNAILSGYAKMGNMDWALSHFRQMPEKNSASWNTMVTGYVGK
ncbi:pentatricopeptide repeat-containing protein At4g22760-like [Durio zibethinus]|uniref:Pentatricopeptide repeat-containing protein At4g22760-like n=1 Tax=Durio zibethinus TaxID=66656 RepID=A0A6P6BJF7_DURZI|nr:pentatricopeptide repeat-containing protein At4g22760-like [Durio zibethinus]